MEIINILSTPLYSGNIPDQHAHLTSVLDSQEIMEVGDFNNFGKRSKNSKILNLKELKTLHDYILSQVKIYTSDVLNYAHEEYKFTQSWISVKDQNEQHASHSHSNSLISGVFYFGESDSKIPQIGFHRSNQSNHCYLQPKFKDNIDPFNTPVFMETPPGKIYMFPSWLHHFVPSNPSLLSRKSLAFNILPTDGLGDEFTSNRVDF